MKRLIVCADGTWKSDDEIRTGHVTNVVKLFQNIPPEVGGVPQKAFYDAGVGGTGSRWDRLLGGLGKGLSENVLDCYRFLVKHFEPGDELYFFGFSRGAFTVRSLAGLVRKCGILRGGGGLTERKLDELVDRAYDLYRDRDADAHPTKGKKAIAFRREHSHEVSIDCVGVFDTVGSLGIPTAGPLGMLLRRRYGFHDVRLSGVVKNGFHALAIDEMRKPFAPTLWGVRESDLNRDGGQLIEQRWFIGVHSNVGGGYENTELSNITLRWMIERVEERTGLRFNPALRESLKNCDCGGTIYNSYSGFYKAFGPHMRIIEEARTDPETGERLHCFETVDDSVIERVRKGGTPRWLPRNFHEFWKKYPDRWAPDRPPS